MDFVTFLLLPALMVAVTAYLPSKEAILTDALLREMTGSLLDPSYLDLADSGPVLASRNLKDLKDLKDLDAVDYELGEDMSPLSPHPSTRDGEYLQHSSLWGHQYLSGGAGEGKQHLRPDGAISNHQQVKTDASLPAYCTPPNPCPVGYNAEDDGCLEQFENTASFSREFQGAQDCMCDQEHMFKCPTQRSHVETRNDLSEADIDRFVHEFQGENSHKNLVAKKFHVKKSSNQPSNPYLQGERLPVAAKKGFHVQ